ncbi:5-formyltetrahydrofolate cyclo-ligase [Arthrobacter sp. HY1533]|uniref:5-formyltetrahydrofolate cyclo-ligase n=1 Tax=Arthrobacter sp. HY1533 TaxID=2970919 RepID=UPI0022B9EA42|nr:5-formyltetrahydrofolate cyclo-ligase [Arthrobacter sp. HY1533]
MITQEKADWRIRLRAARLAAGAAAGEGRALAVAALAWLETFDAGHAPSAAGSGGAPAGGSVCAYISMGTEPPTEDLLGELAASGRTVYVPVCEAGHQLSWVRWIPGVEMARSMLAPVMEPVGPRLQFGSLGPVSAVFIPALAVDESGVRLGQGGGYYDRFLAATAHLRVAAVVHAHEVLPAGTLPHDPLDAPVTHALTAAGHRALGSASH